MDNKKTRKRRAIIACIVYMIMIVFGSLCLYLKKFVNLEPAYIFNIGVDLTGLFIGFVLHICCLIDEQKEGNSNRYFLYLLNVSYLGLFTDLMAWIVNNNPDYKMLNLIDNTLYYMCMPIAALFFWLFITTLIGKKTPLTDKITTAMRIFALIAIITRIINIFTGMYFIIDKDGAYQRATYYPISMLFAYFTLFVSMGYLIKERKSLQQHQFVALILYIIAPLVSAITTMGIYGLSISYGVLEIILLLMYCVVNITQGKEKAASEKELAVATSIQENVLPHVFPPYPDRNEFDLYASMTPAKEVGGDFYDFFLVDDSHLALVIADVSGKGVPAALFMMITKALLKSRLQAGDSPGTALANVNNALLEDDQDSMFVTVWAMVLDLKTGEGIVANAGHEHPAIRKNNGLYELVKYDHSIPVAIMEDMAFKEHHFKMAVGDCLFVYTDGVPEATNLDKQLFGEERMLDALNIKPDGSLKETLENVFNSVSEFCEGAVQSDDLTLLALRYLGK